MSFPTLNPPSQGRCVLNPARDAKTRLQTCETPNRASPLIFAYFIPFTAASAKTEPKPLLSAHGGNRKHSYFILQSFCDMDNTQKNINPASFRWKAFVFLSSPDLGWDPRAGEGAMIPGVVPTPRARDAPWDAQTRGTGLNPFPAPSVLTARKMRSN